MARRAAGWLPGKSQRGRYVSDENEPSGAILAKKEPPVELSSASQGTSAEPRRGDRPGQVPLKLILRGLLMLMTLVGLVAALHYYLGVRLVSDPGLPQPWAVLGWGVLGLGFASIPGAMASTRMRPSWKEQVLHWGGMLWMGAFGLLLTAMVAADMVGCA